MKNLSRPQRIFLKLILAISSCGFFVAYQTTGSMPFLVALVALVVSFFVFVIVEGFFFNFRE